MYMAQPGHIDHIKQVNAGRVYKLIDLKGLFLVSNCPSKVSWLRRVLLKLPANLLKPTLSMRQRFKKPRLVDVLLWVCKPIMKVGSFCRLRLGRGYLTIALHELGGDVLIDTKIDIHERDQRMCLLVFCMKLMIFSNLCGTA